MAIQLLYNLLYYPLSLIFVQTQSNCSSVFVLYIALPQLPDPAQLPPMPVPQGLPPAPPSEFDHQPQYR